MKNDDSEYRKIRVFYVLANYPQLSQTYIKNEIEALLGECDIKIVTLTGPELSGKKLQPYTAYKYHQPFTVEKTLGGIVKKIKEFEPDVIHTHWLNMAPLMEKLARITGVPYTIRAHSFDLLGRDDSFNLVKFLYNWARNWPHYRGFKPKQVVSQLNSDYCLGLLVFPFGRDMLEKVGVASNKIINCFPVIAYAKFLDNGPNGNRIMNVGACIPKKRMEDFIDLACMLPEREFDLYSIGYETPRIDAYNKRKGSPVDIISTLEPEDMPAEYKKHQWLVYTADKTSNTVGWPMAVAEAQAAGVGVCLPNIRPDLQEYLGGAGYVYDTLDQVLDVIQHDVPTDMRNRGFEQARKSDIQMHKSLLIDLWKMNK